MSIKSTRRRILRELKGFYREEPAIDAYVEATTLFSWVHADPEGRKEFTDAMNQLLAERLVVARELQNNEGKKIGVRLQSERMADINGEIYADWRWWAVFIIAVLTMIAAFLALKFSN